MSYIEHLLDTYDQYHTHPTNQRLHRIGVPLVIISVIMLANWFSIQFALHKGVYCSYVVAGSVIGYYLSLDWKKTWLTSLLLILFTCVVSNITGPRPTTFTTILFFSFFTVGWACLLVGHVIEKKRPAFTENLNHLFIGPVYLTHELTSLCCRGIKNLFKRNKKNKDKDSE